MSKSRKRKVEALMAKSPHCFVCGKAVSTQLHSGHPDRATLFGRKSLSCRHCLSVFDKKRTLASPIERRWQDSGRWPKPDPVHAFVEARMRINGTASAALEAALRIQTVANATGRQKNREVVAEGVARLRRMARLEGKGLHYDC